MKKLATILLLGLLVRLALVGVAHHGDLNNNISWGTLLVERGPVGFYGSSDANDWPFSAPNQPPLTLLMFGATSAIYGLVANAATALNQATMLFPSRFIWYWETSGADLMAKLPGILADVGIAWVLFTYLAKHKSEKAGLVGAIAWLANPITWYNSAIWGQTDPIVNLLGLVCVFALLNKKLLQALSFFTLAFLFKGSLAMFVPVLFGVALWQKYPLKIWLKSISAALLLVIVTTIWFHPSGDLGLWLIDLYTTRILPGEIGYLSANAFNLWWLVDSGKVLDSTIYLGLPARFWGLLLVGGSILGTVFWLFRAKLSDKRVFYALALVAFATFLFMTRIHERYLYPLFPYATLLVTFIPWLWFAYTILSAVYLLNMYHLFWAPNIHVMEQLYTNPFFMTGLAMVNLAIFIYMVRQIKAKQL